MVYVVTYKASNNSEGKTAGYLQDESKGHTVGKL